VLTRQATTDKPNVKELEAKGVEIRVADISTASHATLKEVLAGVDVLISTVFYQQLHFQRQLFAAAKEVNANMRVVPDDWATYTPPGIRKLADDV
jgi:hypothetical protein